MEKAQANSKQTNVHGVIVLLGEFASSFFSALMGVIGSAKLLQVGLLTITTKSPLACC